MKVKRKTDIYSKSQILVTDYRGHAINRTEIKRERFRGSVPGRKSSTLNMVRGKANRIIIPIFRQYP